MTAAPLIALAVVLGPIIWAARHQPYDHQLTRDALKKRIRLEDTMRRLSAMNRKRK